MKITSSYREVRVIGSQHYYCEKDKHFLLAVLSLTHVSTIQTTIFALTEVEHNFFNGKRPSVVPDPLANACDVLTFPRDI